MNYYDQAKSLSHECIGKVRALKAYLLPLFWHSSVTEELIRIRMNISFIGRKE